MKKFNHSASLEVRQKTQPQFHGYNSMTINRFRLPLLFVLICGLLAPATLFAAEGGFRLIYIGALSGYVKLCG